jgi:hypothetical protein
LVLRFSASRRNHVVGDMPLATHGLPAASDPRPLLASEPPTSRTPALVVGTFVDNASPLHSGQVFMVEPPGSFAAHLPNEPFEPIPRQLSVTHRALDVPWV